MLDEWLRYKMYKKGRIWVSRMLTGCLWMASYICLWFIVVLARYSSFVTRLLVICVRGVVVLDGDHLVHVPMSLEVRTSALDLWLLLKRSGKVC